MIDVLIVVVVAVVFYIVGWKAREFYQEFR